MTTILIADDHDIFREAFKTYIQHIMPGCGIEEARDGNEAFGKIKDNDYDLIVLDTIMPRTNSSALVRNILSAKPGSRILMFSMSLEETDGSEFLEIGALGFISKHATTDEISVAIENVMNNKR